MLENDPAAFVAGKVVEKIVELGISKAWNKRDAIVELFRRYAYDDLTIIKLNEVELPDQITLSKLKTKLLDFLQQNHEMLVKLTELVEVSSQPNYGEFAQHRRLTETLDLLAKARDAEPDQIQRIKIVAEINVTQEQLSELETAIINFAGTITKIKDPSLRQIEARELFFAGKLDEARILLEAARDEMNGVKDRALAAKAKHQEKLEEINARLLEMANDFLLLAQSTTVNFDSPTRIADASKSFRDSIECAKTFENTFAFGEFLFLHSDFREAIENWSEALKISQARKDSYNIANCLGNIGVGHENLSEYGDSENYLNMALQISNEFGYYDIKIACLGNLATLYFSSGRVDEAISANQQVLEMSRQIGDELSEQNSLGNLGVNYNSQRKTREAAEVLERALKIASRREDLRGCCQIWGTMGIMFRDIEEFDLAIKYQKLSLEGCERLGDRRGMALALGNLGVLSNFKEQPEEASTYFEHQRKIACEIGDKKSEANSWFNQGITLMNLNQKANAIECAEQAIKIYEIIDAPELERVKNALEDWKSK